MDTNEIRERILEEARHHGLTLTEDELNAKVLEAGRLEPDKLERFNGSGGIFNCDRYNYCWSDYRCLTWNKGGE